MWRSAKIVGEPYGVKVNLIAPARMAGTEEDPSEAVAPMVAFLAHWATINDETGYYVPTDVTAWSDRFRNHLFARA